MSFRKRGGHKRLLQLALLAAQICLGTQPAHAAEFYGSVSPPILTGIPPWTVTYQLEIDSGATAERLEVGSDSWAVQYSGAATVTLGQQIDLLPATRIGCPTPQAPFPVTEFSNDLLELPANSQEIVELPLVVSGYPRLTHPLAETFTVTSVAPDGTRTPLAPVTVHGPGLAVPATLDMGLALPKQLRTRSDPYGRHSYRLSGWAERAAAGQFAEFRYWSPTQENTSKRIAKVRIGPDGRFSYLWRPAWGGRYAIGVRYRTQDRRFVTSTGECDVPLTVPGPDPAAAAHVTLTADRRTVAPRLGTACLPVGPGRQPCFDDGLTPNPTRQRLPLSCGRQLSIHTDAAARGVSLVLYRARKRLGPAAQSQPARARASGPGRHDWTVRIPSMTGFNVAVVTVRYLGGGATFSATAVPTGRCGS
jgi:hypothetical protein